MGNTSSTNKVSAQDRSILDLKVQRDKLQQYQRKITIITDRETEIAKECLRNGQKPKALLALRRKKFQESLLAKTDQQLEQLQRLMSDVEFAAVQKDVMYGLQQGTAVLKQIHAEMGGIEKVEKLMEDNAEARAYQREISDMLGGQLSNQEEDEVEHELAAMSREVDGSERSERDKLPDVPQDEVASPQQETTAKMARQGKEHAEPLAA